MIQASLARRALTAIAAVAVIVSTAATPARAASWGHLLSPFSPEAQLRERLNYAAEQRDELRAQATPVICPARQSIATR